MKTYIYALTGKPEKTLQAKSMLDAAEVAAGHSYVNLVNTGNGWTIEERLRTPCGERFVRAIIGTIRLAA